MPVTITQLQKIQQHQEVITCRTCENFIRKQGGENNVFYYCSTKKCFTTRNGLKRINAKDPACPLHPVFTNLTLQ